MLRQPARTFLAKMNFPLSEHSTRLTAIWHLLRLKLTLLFVSNQKILQMRLITDKRILAIFSVLYSLGSSVYGSNPHVLPVMYPRYGFYRGKVFYQIRSYEPVL